MKIDRDRDLDQLIDQTLREFPLDPVPESLMAKIMDQVEMPLEEGRFKISWFDFALSGALALVFGFALDIIQGIFRSPYWRTRLQVELAMFWKDLKYFLVYNQSSVIAILLSSGVVLALLAILASVYWRYTLRSERLPA